METFTPTVILLDLSMPEMDGWEMNRHLKENSVTANIPVIAFSTDTDTAGNGVYLLSFPPEIEVARVVELLHRLRILRVEPRHLHEHVVVDEHAVAVLARRVGVVR